MDSLRGSSAFGCSPSVAKRPEALLTASGWRPGAHPPQHMRCRDDPCAASSAPFSSPPLGRGWRTSNCRSGRQWARRVGP